MYQKQGENMDIDCFGIWRATMFRKLFITSSSATMRWTPLTDIMIRHSKINEIQHSKVSNYWPLIFIIQFIVYVHHYV